jgi:UDP-glucuronate 4-epimerase
MQKNILVTGAAGFIGSHLCEALLKQGYKVYGLDNFDSFYGRQEKKRNLELCFESTNFIFLEGDAGDTVLLNSIEENIDVVAHLAAKAGVLPSLKDPAAYIRNNIEVTNALLEWMRHRQINKLVFASSSSVYGNNTTIPFGEEDAVNGPISPYAFTKRSCELMNFTYHSLYGFNIINLRFFTVYGERQRPDLAIRKFVDNIFKDKPITIYGDGSTARDYTYFADTVSGILAAITYVEQNEKVWEIINLGNHTPVKLIDLVHAIAHAAGKEPRLVYENPKPGDVDITFASIEKAKKMLNYLPETRLEEGLKNFVQWYQKLHQEVEVK